MLRIFFLFVVFFLGCSAVNPQFKEFTVFPVILGYDDQYDFLDEDNLNNKINRLYKNLNVKIKISPAIYKDHRVMIDYCDVFDALEIVLLEVFLGISEEIKEYDIILYLQYPNQTVNIAGCATLYGLKYPKFNWVYVSLPVDEELKINLIMTSYIIIHEIAHLFGIDHKDDGSIMEPAIEDVKYWDFSKKTKKEIKNKLSKFANK